MSGSYDCVKSVIPIRAYLEQATMNAFLTLLKDMFRVPHTGQLPPNCFDTTLHDVIRLHECIDREQSWQAPTEGANCNRAAVYCYSSESDLREKLWRVDRLGSSHGLTVVLALKNTIAIDLPAAVQRRFAAGRLILAPGSERLPGTASIGDLALAATRLGWESITMVRGLQHALKLASDSLREREYLIVLVPSDRDQLRWRKAARARVR